MPNKQCPTCGLEHNQTFKQVVEGGNRYYFICPKGHKHEWEKSGEHDWNYRHSYPLISTKKMGDAR